MKHRFLASVPQHLEVPRWMEGPIHEVLAGEYECGWSGHGLKILDIGANVGAFSLWANLRWPGSRIHAYEPHPDTFAMLGRNLAHLGNVELANVALSPRKAGRGELLFAHPGDGEAMLAEYRDDTFGASFVGEQVTVELMHPAQLPAADIVKLDVEGAEADILEAMDLSAVGLVLLEYQNDANRARILRLMESAFELVSQDAQGWDGLLAGYPPYNRKLRGDHWGHLAFISRTLPPGRLTRDPEPPPPAAVTPRWRRMARTIRRRLQR